MKGSKNNQCNVLGKCLCHSNVTGHKCDQCLKGYSGFPNCSKSISQSTVSKKVLIATGWPFENGLITEIVDLNNPQFSCRGLPPFPYQVAAGAGGLIAQDLPMVCGGNTYIHHTYRLTHDCFVLEDKRWKRTITLKFPLEGMSSTIWKNQLLLLGGQQQRVFGHQKSIQTFGISHLVSKRRSAYKRISYGWSKQCIIKVDENTILVTGGRTGTTWHPTMNEIRSETFYINLKTNRRFRGPSMNSKRYGHGCAKFTFGASNQPMAIVAGGQPWVQTVEIKSIRNRSISPWRVVKSLTLTPSRSYFPMVTLGQNVYIIGGLSTEKKGENGILKMECPSNDLEQCKWNLSGRLQRGRSSHVGIPIPDSMAKKLCL